MRRMLTGLLLGSFLAGPAGAAAPRIVAPRAVSDEITITFLPADSGTAVRSAAGEAWLDMGGISARNLAPGNSRRGAIGHRTVVARRHLAIRLESRSAGLRFATLRAYLATDDGRCRVRVDGILLSAVPAVVDPHSRIGVAMAHVVEIEVEDSLPAGPIASSISWLAESGW